MRKFNIIFQPQENTRVVIHLGEDTDSESEEPSEEETELKTSLDLFLRQAKLASSKVGIAKRKHIVLIIFNIFELFCSAEKHFFKTLK